VRSRKKNEGVVGNFDIVGRMVGVVQVYADGTISNVLPQQKLKS